MRATPRVPIKLIQFPATAASEWTPDERMDYGGAPSGVTG